MILLFGIPLALLIAFAVIMVLLVRTPKEESKKRNDLITAAVVTGSLFVITSVFAGLIIGVSAAIVANM